MYSSILLILYLLIFFPSAILLVRYKAIPSSRRLCVGLGISGVLLAPTVAGFLCELLASVLNIGLLLLIFIGGIGMMLKALFR